MYYYYKHYLHMPQAKLALLVTYVVRQSMRGTKRYFLVITQAISFVILSLFGQFSVFCSRAISIADHH